MASSEIGTLAATIAGIAVALILLFIILIIALYIYISLALMTIAHKTKTAYPWLAWIPIANIYLMVKISKQPWWVMLLFLIGLVPIFGLLVVIGLFTFLWWNICEVRGKPGWLGLFTPFPILNLIMIGIVAWSD